MTSYLPEGRPLDSGKVLYPSFAYIVTARQERHKFSQDSIESHQQEGTQSNEDVTDVMIGPRILLSAPSSNALPSNELARVAEAFGEAFSAMHQSLITQINDYAQLQQLDQTHSQAVLQSTTNAMDREQAAVKLASQISDYQASMADKEDTFSKAMLIIGIVVMAATFISGFVDFGASDMALPLEAEAFGLGDVELEDMAGNALGKIEPPSGDGVPGEGVPNEEGVPDGMQAPENPMPETPSEMDTSAQNTEQTGARNLAKSTEQGAISAQRIAKGIGKILLKMALGAGFASPMLVQGIIKLKVADQLRQLANTQVNVGSALETLQLNNSYFHFLQQLIQRTGSAIQEESNEASEVIDTYASITSAYRGIAYGLADAV
jgi:hypothetical protein